MLPPSPSAPRSFDSSAYSSPHLQTPPSANSNTGECFFIHVCYVSLLAKMHIKLNCEFSHKLTGCVFLLPRFHSGLISPGVSVPVQVPGTEQQSMSQNLGQYWARLQWTPDYPANRNNIRRRKKGHVKKVSRKQYGVTRVLRKHRTEL